MSLSLRSAEVDKILWVLAAMEGRFVQFRSAFRSHWDVSRDLSVAGLGGVPLLWPLARRRDNRSKALGREVALTLHTPAEAGIES
jgi:hypothetical protein